MKERGWLVEARMKPRGPRPLKSLGRGGAKLAEERKAAGVTAVQLSRCMEDLGYVYPQPLLSYIEREYVKLPRGFADEYRLGLAHALHGGFE